MDSRGEGGGGEADAIGKRDGVWACEYVGACNRVCPKGVDLAGAIQRLKIASNQDTKEKS
ncbi:MAG: hypothetical protein ACO2O2_08260 [Acidilobaceae archaeon]